ncbi:hypothetical protein AUP68_07005 [Ilyonectria robusta]
MSTNSPLSEDFADVASSGRNTPTLPTRRVPGRDGFWDSEDAGFPGAHIRGERVFFFLRTAFHCPSPCQPCSVTPPLLLLLRNAAIHQHQLTWPPRPRQQSLDSKGGDNLVGTLVE